MSSKEQIVSELGIKIGFDLAAHVIISFQKRDAIDIAVNVLGVFYRPYVTGAQCIIGTERYPETSMKIDYGKRKHSQAFADLVSCF